MGAIQTLNDWEYICSVAKSYKPLSQEEECVLFEKYRSANDLLAAEKITTHSMQFIIPIVNNFKGYGLSLADMFQEGVIALMRAVKTFDISQNVRFMTYAGNWVTAAIYNYVIDNIKSVKIVTTKVHRKLFFKLNSMLNGDRLTSDKILEISAALEVTPEDVTDMAIRMNKFSEISKDAMVSLNEDEIIENELDSMTSSCDILSEILQSEQDELTVERLEEALNTLSERERDIVVSRHIAEQSSTLSELSIKYGVSIERIRQIEESSMKKLKVAIQDSEFLK
jgi:RNA polymerase sigma-32 factor